MFKRMYTEGIFCCSPFHLWDGVVGFRGSGAHYRSRETQKGSMCPKTSSSNRLKNRCIRWQRELRLGSLAGYFGWASLLSFCTTFVAQGVTSVKIYLKLCDCIVLVTTATLPLAYAYFFEGTSTLKATKIEAGFLKKGFLMFLLVFYDNHRQRRPHFV